MAQRWRAHASATVSAQLSPQHTCSPTHQQSNCTAAQQRSAGPRLRQVRRTIIAGIWVAFFQECSNDRAGRCFNLSATERSRAGQGGQPCARFVGTAGGVCPSVGVAHACVPSLDSRTDVCQTPEMVAWQHGHVPGGRCEQTRACALLPGARELASASCLCKPRDFASCEFSPSSCPSDSPYFPS